MQMKMGMADGVMEDAQEHPRTIAQLGRHGSRLWDDHQHKASRVSRCALEASDIGVATPPVIS